MGGSYKIRCILAVPYIVKSLRQEDKDVSSRISAMTRVDIVIVRTGRLN
jgi:hypothetical protein